MEQDIETNDHGVIAKIIYAIQQRSSMIKTFEAYRLFNGFYEGYPGLVFDRYGSTLVIFNHNTPGTSQHVIQKVADWGLQNIQGLKVVLLKERLHPEEKNRTGQLIRGTSLADSVTEWGVRYALNLQLNQDASFYLDTRGLRYWLKNNVSAQHILNTFAYTGSLGVAAGAGNAIRVVQTDINQKFLDLAQRSWHLNAFEPNRCTTLQGDFFKVVGKMRLQQRLFDGVILDPPFFSDTDGGRVDLKNDTTRLINKVRPLVAHQGWIIVINNALYLSGEDFMNEIKALCQSKYLSFEKIISVPPDITGYPDTIVTPPPVNPAPFNHPTKITLLQVFRKDGQKVARN